LVVIVIIGILATLATVTLSSARSKARDARRLSDVKQIQTALELYNNDATTYPASNLVVSGAALVYGTTTYMAKIPADPLLHIGTSDSTNCPAGTLPSGSYGYAQQSGGSSYSIRYCLTASTGNISAGTHQATPASIQNP